MRAGGCSGKNAPNSSFSSANELVSATSTVVLTTRSGRLPPARRTASRLANACRACSPNVGPAGSPVPGSIPGCPETKSNSPARTACEYGPICGGRPGPVTTSRSMPVTTSRLQPLFLRRRRVEDGFDVVPVGIEDECGVVRAAVLGAEAGRPVVATAVRHGGGVPTTHGVRVVCAERDVRADGRTVAARLGADAVQGEIVVRPTAEQNVRVALERPFRQRRESELAERGFVHPAARLQVARSNPHVVDDLAHRREPTCRIMEV